MWYFFSWLVLPFMVTVSFYGNFGSWKNFAKLLATIFSPLFHLHCYRRVAVNPNVYSRLFCQTPINEMPSLIRKEKITCENCVTQTTRNNIVRHKKRCSVGTLYCTQCPNFCTKSQNDLNYHIAKKHSAPKLGVTFKCKLCFQEFPGYYAVRQHRNSQHGMQIGSKARDVDLGDVENHRLRKELRSCQHFLLDSELERARHKVFNYAVESLNEKTIMNDKLDNFFNNLKCAAKVNLAFGFILKTIEDGRFRYFYANKNKTLLDRSKFVCTHDHLVKLKDVFNQYDVIESCSR